MIRISDVRRVGGSGRMAKNAPILPILEPKNSAHSANHDAASQQLDQLLGDAIKAGATTIHLEPQGKEVIVRHRVDGLLRQVKVFKLRDFTILTAYLKVLANLDSTETRVPQDGRFDRSIGSSHAVVRTNILPVADGEKIVLQITDQSARPDDLTQLGYWGHSLLALKDIATHARGLVVVSGPGGSGKSATLYGLLSMVSDQSKSAITVEDVIERRLPGVNQTAVNVKAGLTYGDTLRAALNQDPNILMLSDIRDPQTAQLVVDSALAGKYLLAGMHTYDTAGTLSRLTAMGVAPYLLATSVTAVANQRLLRKLCTHCREAYKPEANDVTQTIRECGLNPVGALRRLAELEPSARTQYKGGAEPSLENGKLVRLWRAKSGGCKACDGSGYSGRTAIAEVLLMSPALQKIVAASGPAESIYDQAITEGMLPLPMDGLVKVALGITSLDELLRVITA